MGIKYRISDTDPNRQSTEGYDRTEWVDGGEPPLNEGNLNHIENGIKRVTEAFNTLVGDADTNTTIPKIIETVSGLAETIKNISLDNLAETDPNYEIILDGGEIKEIEENE